MLSLDTPRAQVQPPPERGTSQFLLSGNVFDQQYGHDHRGPLGSEPGRKWLRDTPLLQIDHPKVRLLGLKLTQLKSGDREKALACFEFVRHLQYACSSDAARMPSVEVLAAKMGDGFSKSTLFIALLRCLGIPARLRVVLLRPAYLRGLAGMEEGLAEHAFTEVLIDGEWLAVDSYVVDLALGLRARTRLFAEGWRAGYGVHMKGQVSWDGRSSSFGQFSCEDPASLPMLDLGAHDDVQHFQDSLGPNVSTSSTRKRWSFASVIANRRIRHARSAPA